MAWVNPFQQDQTQPLMMLSSGTVATPEVQSDLEKALSKGSVAFQSFVKTRLIEGKVKVLDTLSKLKLKTFRSLSVKKQVRTSGKLLQL